MFSLIALEWIQLWRGRILPLCLLCSSLCAGAALWTTLQSNRMQQRAAEQAASAEYDRWLAQGPKYAHAAAHYGMYALRPVYGTSNAEPGVTAYTGQTVYMEAHVQDPAVYRSNDDEQTGFALGSFTPLLVCRTVLPLFVIVLAVASMANDRQRGTLRLNLLHSPDAFRILGSRAAAAFFFPAALALVTALIALSAAVVFHMPEAAHPEVRWPLLLVTAVWPSLLWACVSVALSSYSCRSSTALTATLALWVLTALLVPRAAIILSEHLSPSSTRQQLSSNIREATGESGSPLEEQQFTRTLLRRYGVSRIEDLPVSIDGMRREHAEEAGDLVFDRFWGDLFHHYAVQDQIQRALSFLSPELADTKVATTAAATGLASQSYFLQAAEKHRRLIQRTLNEELARRRPASDGPRPISSADVWRRIPKFQLAPVPLGARASGSWVLPVLAILMQSIAAVAFLHFAAKRLERNPA